jgi:methyl coenzyme M reductase beta subunit
MDFCVKCLCSCLKVEESNVSFSVYSQSVMAILAGNSVVTLHSQRINIGRNCEIMLINILCKFFFFEAPFYLQSIYVHTAYWCEDGVLWLGEGHSLVPFRSY